MSSANMETQHVNVQRCRYFTVAQCFVVTFHHVYRIKWALYLELTFIPSLTDICLQIKEKHLLAQRDDVVLDPLRALNWSMTHKNRMWRWPRHAKDFRWAVRPLCRWQQQALLSISPSHRHQNHAGVAFTGILSCWNIALIPLLSVGAHFGSLWSLNNFARLCFPPRCICISLSICLVGTSLWWSIPVV